MKAQKLVFVAHGFHLAITGEPLINEQVEAWKYGPVIRSLFKQLQRFGNGEVTEQIVLDINGRALERTNRKFGRAPHVEDFDYGNPEFIRSLLVKVWEGYGRFTGIQLSNMTHLPNTPWSKVMEENNGDPPRGTDIPPGYIRDYFQQLLPAKS